MNWLKTALTGKDNESTDIIRLLLFCVAVVFIVVYIAGEVKFLLDYNFPIERQTASMKDFATAFLLLFTGAGAAIFAKQSTEPEEKSDDTKA